MQTTPRTFIYGLILLSLTACAGGKTATFTLTTDQTDPEKVTALTEAGKAIVIARLENLEVKNPSVSVKAGPPATVTARVQDAAMGEKLAQQLTAPFKLNIRLEVPKGQGDISIPEVGDYKDTGLTEKDIAWTTATENPTGKGEVTLIFTETGKTKVEQIFSKNMGKTLGLFVRDRLMATLLINESTVKGNIVISGIPSLEIAKLFSSDVNVGLHITFTPQP